jgi:tricarballylate dehydrogenase
VSDFDVVVAGGGNAALCAALAARRRGARVLLLERTTREWRGGNSKYTRNIRCATDAYPEEELLADLVEVAGDGADRDLASFTIGRSRTAPAWMEAHGVRWQPALSGTLQLSRTNQFFLGGGKALVNTYYEAAQRLGVEVRYGSSVTELTLSGDRCTGVVLEVGGRVERLRTGAIVVATGGFEADLGWLRKRWGDAVDGFRVRGSRWNDGSLLRHLMALGAQTRGNPDGFHAIAVDGRSPMFDGGIATRVDSVPLGIVINREGLRFADEGEDLWPKRYASWGRLIALQPGQVAWSLFDARAAGRFIPTLWPPLRADSIPELAAAVGLDPARVVATVAAYNAAAGPGALDASRLDGFATHGLQPAKSNWALPIDRPPFYCYPLRPGITFTYEGVAVDQEARLLRQDGGAFENVFAAGEIMAGCILREGYLGGFGMTIGTVFGRLAGEAAARHI